jgi:hypothetical protein
MEPIKKTLYCSVLGKDIVVSFDIGEILGRNGEVKKKYVKFFDCESKEACGVLYNVSDCICYKEARKAEVEVNGL